MEKFILILGNITFDNFVDAEIEMFKKNPLYNEQSKVALVHSISGLLVFDSIEKAAKIGDELCECAYVVPALWCGKLGNLLIFENKGDEDLLYKSFDILTN